ncbi:hypothetical protein KFE25_004088 [Diacronema lutheri]|uniref:ENTH domain-containing protein n=1 Tax=Diacronema lutheri TaxID=2081491 RepID=A0A8J5XIE3_DIALT|nr:hypothetical protein KFE25_004088 [Diacronema lutheri]
MPQIPSKFIPKTIREKVGSAEFKAKIREVKNKVLDYTEAEMLVREATCNSTEPVNPVLCRGVVKYVRTPDWPPIVAIISKRLGSKNANHPLKVMQLIEILLNETTGPEHEAVWRDIVIQNQSKLEELRHFEKVVDRVDAGVKVRPLAVELMKRIRAEQHKRDDASLGLPSGSTPQPTATGASASAAAASAQPGSHAVSPPTQPTIAHAQPAAALKPPPAAAAGGANLLDFDLLSLDAPPQPQPQAQQQPLPQQQPMHGGPIWGGQQPHMQPPQPQQPQWGAPQPQQQQWGQPQPMGSNPFQ